MFALLSSFLLLQFIAWNCLCMTSFSSLTFQNKVKSINFNILLLWTTLPTTSIILGSTWITTIFALDFTVNVAGLAVWVLTLKKWQIRLFSFRYKIKLKPSHRTNIYSDILYQIIQLIQIQIKAWWRQDSLTVVFFTKCLKVDLRLSF